MAELTNKERITANNEKIDELIALVRQKKLDSFVLPELTNPAIENEVFQGKEFIKGDGQVGIGTYVQPEPAEDLDAERAEHESIVAELEAEIEGLDDKETSKLQLIIGAQDVDAPYTITQDDVGEISEIPQYFFYKKLGLVGVDIESVVVLGQYAFYECNNLIEVNLPNVENIGAYCFQKCDKIKHFNFSKATIIGQQAFSNCAELETLDISNATSIGSYMCNSCVYLTEVKMEKAKTIDSYAFQHCYRLGYISIPATCTKIANNVFTNVGRATESGKATYRFLGDTPPSIYANSFSKDYIDKIIVNKGCGDTYRSATNWANFADYIVEVE